jgi:hypothetical protein
MSELSPLENAVLDAICKEMPDEAHAISSQMSNLNVLRRENTGHGFFSYFAGTRPGPPIGHRALPAGSAKVVAAWIKGLKNPVIFVLFTREGKLHMLDGSAIEEATNDVDFFTAEFELCIA